MQSLQLCLCSSHRQWLLTTRQQRQCHVTEFGWNSAAGGKIFLVLLIWRKGSWWLVRHHDDVIKRKHFPRYWPFMRGIHRWPVNSPHKGQWRGALMFPWSVPWINGWVNNREAGDLRRHRAHYGVTVMILSDTHSTSNGVDNRFGVAEAIHPKTPSTKSLI